MSNLTSEEKIARVEQAPKEVQTMVAKAFLREDIDDENVQYSFNTDNINELLGKGSIAQNINAEQVEGIGSEGFTRRTWKPSSNKYYITVGNGGWSYCIKGYPTDKNANVLSNCVGYASGRFNEIIGELRGSEGTTYKNLNCNAENFIERAKANGLEVGSTPRVGAIMCWQKGTLASGDGAGHVAVVEAINNDGSIYTSESAYGGAAFFNSTRNNSNGRWGQGSAYSFRGFIYLPKDVQDKIGGSVSPVQNITEPVNRDIYRDQIEVVISDLRVRASASGSILGFAKPGVYNYSAVVAENGYEWYQIGENQWIASKDGWTIVYPKTIPTPAPEPVPAPVTPKFNIGDSVKIIGTGNGNSLGTSGTAYGVGWTRQILKIWDGRAYPYQVGNSSGTTGFYQESALERV